MVTKTHIDSREFGRIVNILAVLLHFLLIFLGVVILDYYPLIAINLLLHICYLYGNSKHKLGFMLLPLFLWFIPAFVSIVYLISSAFYPVLYANWYLIVCACLFLGFFVACILATDSISRADTSNHSNDPQLNVCYTAAKQYVQDNLIA